MNNKTPKKVSKVKRIAETSVSKWFKVSSYLVPRLSTEDVNTVMEIRASVQNPDTGNWCSRTVSRLGFDSLENAYAEAKALRKEALAARSRTASTKGSSARLEYVMKAAFTGSPVSSVGGTTERSSNTIEDRKSVV